MRNNGGTIADKQKDKLIVVFAGAGASKAIGPTEYPTTVEYLEQLPDRIKSLTLYKSLLEFASQPSKSKHAVDIEVLLWRLQELSDFFRKATDQREVAGWFVSGERLTHALDQGSVNYGQFQNTARSAIPALKSLQDQVNENVYDLYAKLPSPERLSVTWIPLLTRLLDSEARVELFTTNYDLVLESALDQLGDRNSSTISPGWTGSVLRKLDLSLWTGDRGSERRGLLTKLHGSVNWTKRDGEVFLGGTLFSGSHAKHAILYPGFKGAPEDAVFQAFHSHFSKTLAQASAVLFIGFAFRDEYISSLLSRHLHSNASVVVIDPSEELAIPIQGASHIKKGFDEGSVDEALQRLASLVG